MGATDRRLRRARLILYLASGYRDCDVLMLKKSGFQRAIRGCNIFFWGRPGSRVMDYFQFLKIWGGIFTFPLRVTGHRDRNLEQTVRTFTFQAFQRVPTSIPSRWWNLVKKNQMTKNANFPNSLGEIKKKNRKTQKNTLRTKKLNLFPNSM